MTSQTHQAADGGPPLPKDAFGRYRFAGNVIALLILFTVLLDYWVKLNHPQGVDFISFWGAARFALAGDPAGAYDYQALQPVQLSAAGFDGELPFPYPPILLLVLMPFALLPYAAAMAVWTAATCAGYIAAARRLFPGSGWMALAFPAVLANSFVGQNAFLTAGIFMLGLYLLPRRPFLAGIVLGCLVIKPQLALLLPVAVLAARQWRAVAGAAVSSLSALLAGAALFGPAATRAWLDQMPYYVEIARSGTVGWHKLASVNAALRHAGVDAAPAMAIHLLVALVAAAAVWRVWSSDSGWGARGAVLAAATMLGSPYLYLYDSLLLAIPFRWLAQGRSSPLLLGLIWCLPALVLVQTVTSPHLANIAPLIPMSLLLLAWLRISGSPRPLIPGLRLPAPAAASTN